MKLRRRLERARQEMLNYSSYDFVIINDDLERAGAGSAGHRLGSALPGGAERRADSRNFEVFWRLTFS